MGNSSCHRVSTNGTAFCHSDGDTGFSLSAGAVVGIVIGVVACVILLVIIVYCCCKKHRPHLKAHRHEPYAQAPPYSIHPTHAPPAYETVVRNNP